MKNRQTKFFLACIVGVTVILPVTSLAIGISATPATLSLETTVGGEGVTRFTVSNPSREVGLFVAYPEEFEELIVLIPSRFVLEAGEKREIVVRARGREIGVRRTAIAIETEPLGVPSQGVGGGVRLPLSFETVAGNSLLSAVFVTGAGSLLPWLLLGVLTVLFLVRKVSLSPLKWRKPGSTL